MPTINVEVPKEKYCGQCLHLYWVRHLHDLGCRKYDTGLKRDSIGLIKDKECLKACKEAK